MVDIQTKEVYSQVYGILNMLGNRYINLLPNELYKKIQKEKSNSYNPEYTNLVTLTEQNIKKEALTIIALFHLNYWCKTEDDKIRLKNIFQENEIKQKENNTKNLLKDKTKEISNESKNSLIVKQEKKNIFKNILMFIKKVLKKQEKRNG